MNRAEAIHTSTTTSNRTTPRFAVRRQLTRPVVQRGADGSTCDTRDAQSVVGEVVTSEGVPLDSGPRRFFEPRFGHNFGHVRIHTNSPAAASARALNALAYTVGHDIVFAPGRYAPQTVAGKRLLAHELTHVIQQSGTPSSSLLQRAGTDQPAVQTGSIDQAAASSRSAVTQQITISGEMFDLVGVGQPLTSESSAWRYRGNVNDYLSVYPNLGNGWWALIVRPGDGAPCNIGGNCLGWTLGSYTTSDPPQEVWGLTRSYLDSVNRRIHGHKSPQDTYLRQVKNNKFPATALWDYFMVQQFHAVPAASDSEANLALYGRGFSGPMEGPSHIAFRTSGGEKWVSKPSAAKPPIVHETAAQMTGGETGDVLRLYVCPSGPPNEVLLSQGQSQGGPSP
ncbi:MAG: hypothetical protein ABS70_02495 [Nitrospira sp. SCN 59-13]|nr:MAG: hypothetical protein ABS70_02495 [Nitrospira sp. SCN 59-13]